MSKRLNEAKALRRGAITALIIITILMSGCGNPVGGVENNSVADFVGKSYKSQYDELFTIAAPDTIKLGYGTDYNTEGKIVASKSTDAGTVYLLKCSTHSNYSPSQYPDFNEENPIRLLSASVCSFHHRRDGGMGHICFQNWSTGGR